VPDPENAELLWSKAEAMIKAPDWFADSQGQLM
jgi:hypothetical protein